MSEIDFSLGLDGLEVLLQDKARELVSVLDTGDVAAGLNIISDLQQVKHRAFYNEVGYLTRGLHEAIKSFSSDVAIKNDPNEEAIQGMADASERLAYVIEVTEKTSHETMDRVDKSLALVDKMDEQSERFKDLLSLVGQLEAEFEGLRGVYDRTCQLKEESEKTVADMRSELTEILVAQSYQDITGQLIRRVITLVTQVESSLVQLMDMAAKVERISGLDAGPSLDKSDGKKNKKDPIEAEGPQIGGKDNPNVACNQDDVDDLLSSLGF
ncbi:protein phosphatase CheZ [Neptunomonas concharum]|uniref:Protein phosphatase CheZ n=1 Tax=Neptunomonas concharum TaxID=1031538 RepID=A0A5P1R943_9GAMM|nr:protein phosphatase CheZ [Neptunomonas concharum]QEQ95816.1 protein phosphatase CheZ [Neptunomonas concharum]